MQNETSEQFGGYTRLSTVKSETFRMKLKPQVGIAVRLRAGYELREETSISKDVCFSCSKIYP